MTPAFLCTVTNVVLLLLTRLWYRHHLSLLISLCVYPTAQCELEGPEVLSQKLDVAGGPVFALTKAVERKDESRDKKSSHASVYCGLAGKDIVTWDPLQPALNEKVGCIQGTAGICMHSTCL